MVEEERLKLIEKRLLALEKSVRSLLNLETQRQVHEDNPKEYDALKQDMESLKAYLAELNKP